MPAFYRTHDGAVIKEALSRLDQQYKTSPEKTGD
jgi:hypothetical protein